MPGLALDLGRHRGAQDRAYEGSGNDDRNNLHIFATPNE